MVVCTTVCRLKVSRKCRVCGAEASLIWYCFIWTLFRRTNMSVRGCCVNEWLGKLLTASDWLHETESYLRGERFLRFPRNSPCFMEPKGLRPLSKQPTTVLNQVHTIHSFPSHFLLFLLRRGLPSVLFSWGFPTKNLNPFLFCLVVPHVIHLDSITRITRLPCHCACSYSLLIWYPLTLSYYPHSAWRMSG